MPTRRQLIQKITLNANASSVTFSNIPQNYTDLKIVYSARTTAALEYDDLKIRFNSSATGYSSRMIYSYSTTTASATFAEILGIIISGDTATTATFGSGYIYIPNYTSSNNKIVSLSSASETNSSTTAYMEISTGLWSNTSAINSITIDDYSGGQSIKSGSTFYLYGITQVPIIRGGTVTIPGDGFKYHTFNSSGSLQVIEGGDVEYLVVAGGGGGGNGGGGTGGGGGGAGGMKNGKISLPNSLYSVTVGGGGNGATVNQTVGVQGSNSSFSGNSINISSTGGGYGSQYTAGTSTGGSGGSGGGGGNAPTSIGGTAVAGEGNNGGAGVGPSTSPYTGGGGGGKGAVGDSGASGGNGGAGQIWPTGASTYYAGGGGAAKNSGSISYGGSLIGGSGAVHASISSTSGKINTGSGGGAGTDGTWIGSSGGSGIVIIRYPYDGN